jgi:hypothetical protein
MLAGNPTTPYDCLIAPVGVQKERHGELEPPRVLPNGTRLLPEFRREDRESSRGILTMEPVEHRQFRAARVTPRRPEVHEDDVALQAFQ